MGLVLSPLLEKVVAIWPVAGVALAAFLICGNRVIPGIFLANLLIHAFLPIPVPAMLALSAAATAGPALAAWGLRRWGLDLSLASVRDAARFATVAGLQAGIATPTIGVLVLAATRSLSWNDAAELWGPWAMADGTATLAITPLLVWLHSAGPATRRSDHPTEFLFSAALLLAVTVFCYSLSQPVG